VGSDSFAARNQEANNNQKNEIVSMIGQDKFDQIYEFLKYHRQKQTEEDRVQQEIKFMTNGDKTLMNHAFQIDCLIFKELF
jgi:hypothetical protein